MFTLGMHCKTRNYNHKHTCQTFEVTMIAIGNLIRVCLCKGRAKQLLIS